MSRDLVVFLVALWGVVGWPEGGWAQTSSGQNPSWVAAIHDAAPGDTVMIPPGAYQLEQLVLLDKPITIIGQGRPEIKAPEEDGIFQIQADSVSIQGLSLTGVKASYTEDLAAIWIDGAQHFQVKDNRIQDCFFAIFCTKGENGLIQNNVICGDAISEHSSANAIHLWHADSIKIWGNHVEGHRDGIYLEFTDNSTIQHNWSGNHLRYGLHFMFSNQDRYTHNVFTQNGAGVAVMFSDSIVMLHNTFEENWGDASYGLLLKEIYDGEIRQNTFRRNTIGILAEGSTRVLYKANDFSNNGWALKLRGSAMDNIFSYNNFRENSFSVASDRTRSSNEFHHNYWSGYTGYDLDHDGIGDVPHRPVSLFSFLVTRVDASILLLRSTFIEVLNLAERIAPAITPEQLVDPQPLLQPHQPL